MQPVVVLEQLHAHVAASIDLEAAMHESDELALVGAGDPGSPDADPLANGRELTVFGTRGAPALVAADIVGVWEPGRSHVDPFHSRAVLEEQDQLVAGIELDDTTGRDHLGPRPPRVGDSPDRGTEDAAAGHVDRK